MAAIIAAYGHKNERYITPNSSMMIHSITVCPSHPESVGTSKLTTDFFNQDYIAKVKNLSRRVGPSYKKLLELMESTHWMNAKAAIKIGFVDKIWTPRHESEVDTIWRKIRAQKKANN
jgi:ATP-dependent protease ClpP protease subunit